jgi:hypothetical protein
METCGRPICMLGKVAVVGAARTGQLGFAGIGKKRNGIRRNATLCIDARQTSGRKRQRIQPGVKIKPSQKRCSFDSWSHFLPHITGPLYDYRVHRRRRERDGERC